MIDYKKNYLNFQVIHSKYIDKIYIYIYIIYINTCKYRHRVLDLFYKIYDILKNILAVYYFFVGTWYIWFAIHMINNELCSIVDKCDLSNIVINVVKKL